MEAKFMGAFGKATERQIKTFGTVGNKILPKIIQKLKIR